MKKIGHIGNWKIKASYHALTRMKERSVSQMEVVSCIISFGEEMLATYAGKKVDLVVIDRKQGIHVIFTVKNTKIEVITVVGSENVFAKNYPDTKMYEVNWA